MTYFLVIRKFMLKLSVKACKCYFFYIFDALISISQVRNKLDGCYYAIKRIELNPKNKQLKKKMLREVKLLSRLNHENVVRYYNSWIETALIDVENSDSSSGFTSSEAVPQIVRKKEVRDLVFWFFFQYCTYYKRCDCVSLS